MVKNFPSAFLIQERIVKVESASVSGRMVFGYGMMELLLALIVGAGVLLMSIRHYSVYAQALENQTLQNDIALLFHGLQVYYHQQHCPQGVFPAVDVDLSTAVQKELAREGVVWKTPPLGVSFYAGVASLPSSHARPLYRLVLRATFDPLRVPAERLQWYAKALDAERIDRNNLYWSALPMDGGVATTSRRAGMIGSAWWFKDVETLADDVHCAH